MKTYIAQYQPGRIGGGWTFMQHFANGMGDLVTQDYEEADMFFICSPSMVQREEVQKAKDDGKKVVLRIDNAVRNSRNRNTGMSRMKDFYDWADLVVFQSQWAAHYLTPFLDLGRKMTIILNGVELALYQEASGDPNRVLYSRFNRDETKNWEVARYWFSQYQLDNPSAHLSIVGQFSPELVNGNFDFYNGERYQYHGVASREAMAGLYQACGKLLYTYYNDACSNTLIEALVSGCEIVGNPYYMTTGGAYEIFEKFKHLGRDYFSVERMCNEYKSALEAL